MTSAMSTDLNSSINSLLTMGTTTSLAKNTVSAYLESGGNPDSAVSAILSGDTSSLEKTSDVSKAASSASVLSTKEDYDYVEEMDYDEDGEITISEKLRYYAEQISDKIKEANKTNINTQTNGISHKLTQADYQKVGMGDYYTAQTALQMSKALSSYTYNILDVNINTFKINV